MAVNQMPENRQDAIESILRAILEQLTKQSSLLEVRLVGGIQAPAAPNNAQPATPAVQPPVAPANFGKEPAARVRQRGIDRGNARKARKGGMQPGDVLEPIGQDNGKKDWNNLIDGKNAPPNRIVQPKAIDVANAPLPRPVEMPVKEPPHNPVVPPRTVDVENVKVPPPHPVEIPAKPMQQDGIIDKRTSDVTPPPNPFGDSTQLLQAMLASLNSQTSYLATIAANPNQTVV